MITSNDLSQEIFAINVLKAMNSSLKPCREHFLQLLQLYGDQALHLAESICVTAVSSEPGGRLECNLTGRCPFLRVYTQPV